MFKQKEILGTKLHFLTYQEIISLVNESIQSKVILNILYVNFYITFRAEKDSILKDILNNEIFSIPDGVGIYIASKILYPDFKIKEVITGTDLYYRILKIANENNWKLFFLGGSSNASACIAKKLETSYPSVVFVGAINREKYKEIDIVNTINKSNPDIIFIGLGTPEQEYWLKRNSDKLVKSVRICCGSGIEFISGAKPRAPYLMRKIGLEWLFRLFVEPRRLWKRYLIGIPVFVFKILFLKVKLTLKKE